MPFYKISSLPLPVGKPGYSVNKINDNLAVTGSSDDGAMLWHQGSFKVMNVPGQQYSTGIGINSKQQVVGFAIVPGWQPLPFFWDTVTGSVTVLKGYDGQDGHGIARAINDSGQITGSLVTNDATAESNASQRFYDAVLWETSTAVPIKLTSGPSQVDHSGWDINNDGFVVGQVGSNVGPDQAFTWDPINQFKLIQANWYGFKLATAANNLVNPQVVGVFEPEIDVYHAFLYDTLSTLLLDISIPGDLSDVSDINDNGQIVGSANEQAVLLNGLVRIDLNHPAISDAKAKGWNLLSATGINNKGCIVGYGDKGPWLLEPAFKIKVIPVEYMLPHFLWPGDPYDSPRPKGWPLRLPFPIPSPNPFQLVGPACKQLNDILIARKVNELSKLMTDTQASRKIQKIANEAFEEEMKKLKDILNKNFINREKV